MGMVRRILKTIFCLPLWLTVLIAVPSFAFVFVMLGTGNDSSVLSYVSYGLSAYSLVIAATCTLRIVQMYRQGQLQQLLMEKFHKTQFGAKYWDDALFRSEISLYRELLINLLYIAVKLFCGIWYRSVWFASLAVYYIFLSVMRFLLLHHVRRAPIGHDIPSEYRRYRICGCVLLLMNLALIGIISFIVLENKGFSYPGYLIYAFAAYTFYSVISAGIYMVKVRRHQSPVLSAAKAIKLTAALVSLLSLETAMFTAFGEQDVEFRRIMTASTGGVINVTVLAMAIYMIVRASKELKRLQMTEKIDPMGVDGDERYHSGG